LSDPLGRYYITVLLFPEIAISHRHAPTPCRVHPREGVSAGETLFGLGDDGGVRSGGQEHQVPIQIQRSGRPVQVVALAHRLVEKRCQHPESHPQGSGTGERHLAEVPHLDPGPPLGRRGVDHRRAAPVQEAVPEAPEAISAQLGGRPAGVSTAVHDHQRHRGRSQTPSFLFALRVLEQLRRESHVGLGRTTLSPAEKEAYNAFPINEFDLYYASPLLSCPTGRKVTIKRVLRNAKMGANGLYTLSGSFGEIIAHVRMPLS
jgi:hypothetical protein